MTPQDILQTGAHELGIEITPGQMLSIFQFITELNKWNRKINLTAIRDERDIVVKHILDSLAYLKGFSITPGIRLLDMGAGAGLPAIPIKIVRPSITTTLVESVKKKASFLRHVVRTLNLTSIEVVDQRIEELPALFRAAYDIVTARAFADIITALTTGQSFLKKGGLMVLSRGPEETLSMQEINKSGFGLVNRIVLTLPHSDYKRAIWVFKRIV